MLGVGDSKECTEAKNLAGIVFVPEPRNDLERAVAENQLRAEQFAQIALGAEAEDFGRRSVVVGELQEEADIGFAVEVVQELLRY